MADSRRLVPRRLTEPLVRAYAELSEKVDGLHSSMARLEDKVDRVAEMSRYIYDDEPANRRRLAHLREREEYQLAFSEKEPLVSFLIPTYNSHKTLGEVTLPSILNQNYSNIEVVVVGDAAPPETAEVIQEV